MPVHLQALYITSVALLCHLRLSHLLTCKKVLKLLLQVILVKTVGQPGGSNLIYNICNNF